MTPSVAKEVGSFAPTRATPTVGLQERSEPVVAIGCLDRVPRCVARRRACPQVPASPKMYPSRTCEVAKSRHNRQHHMPICRAFPKPSDGLEPWTPPYHQVLARCVGLPTVAKWLVWAVLEEGRLCHRLPPVASAPLHKCSIPPGS